MVTIDDFEDNDFSEYTVSTNATSFGGGGGIAPNSSQSAQLQSGFIAQSDHQKAFTQTGLPAYPTKGGADFECYLRASGGTQRIALIFGGTRSVLRHYYAGFEIKRSSKIIIGEYAANSHQEISSTASSKINKSETYRLRVSWESDGTITATLYDLNDTQLVSTSTVSNRFDTGLVGVYAFNTDDFVAKFDDIRTLAAPPDPPNAPTGLVASNQEGATTN